MIFFEFEKSMVVSRLMQISLILGLSACSSSKNADESNDSENTYNNDQNVNNGQNSSDNKEGTEEENNSVETGINDTDTYVGEDTSSDVSEFIPGTEKSDDSDEIDDTTQKTVDTDIGTNETEPVDDVDASTSKPDTGIDSEVESKDTEAEIPVDLQDCEASEEFLDADCGSYTTFQGTFIELGPYGAHLDYNVGVGYETEIAMGDRTSLLCRVFSAAFDASEEEVDRLLDTADLDFALHAVYRPAYFKDGEKYPLIVWGNGTCAMPEGYGTILRYVASYGFFVVAPNSRWVGGNDAMSIALDYMFDANEDSDSPYYQKIDTEKVGAMGHSQGGGATATIADGDERVKAAILFNGGEIVSKPFLTVSGDRDVSDYTVEEYQSRVNSSSQPAAFLYYHKIPEGGSMTGHLTLMQEPERVIEPTMHWFNFMLNKDEDSSKWFLGDDCQLCNKDEDFEYGQKGLDSVLGSAK